MMMFHDLFPEIGADEYRSVILVDAQSGVPPGEYGFVEAYCVRPGCDCRNLLLNVLGTEPPRHLATLNFHLDPGGFQEIGEDSQVFLDPGNVQSQHSMGLKGLFEEALMADPSYLERLERHLAMVKQRVGGNTAGASRESTTTPAAGRPRMPSRRHPRGRKQRR